MIIIMIMIIINADDNNTVGNPPRWGINTYDIIAVPILLSEAES